MSLIIINFLSFVSITWKRERKKTPCTFIHQVKFIQMHWHITHEFSSISRNVHNFNRMQQIRNQSNDLIWFCIRFRFNIEIQRVFSAHAIHICVAATYLHFYLTLLTLFPTAGVQQLNEKHGIKKKNNRTEKHMASHTKSEMNHLIDLTVLWQSTRRL